MLDALNVFLTHFPSAKSCKFYAEKPLDDKTKILLKSYFSNLQEDISANKSIRLRGGAGNVDNQSPLIVQRAITSAEKHGIALVQGILNKADGNCAFDAVLNNINHRNCFVNKLSLPSTVYRQVWVTELEMESSNYPALGAGYTKEEKEENWNQLKQSGVYEVDFFGDMVIHAIARGCNKNILIFNTNIEAADPIYVIQANHFGGFSDTDIPIVIAYNQVHYESLHPLTDQDTEKTKMLMHSYINGTYQYKKKDIPFLISASSWKKSETASLNMAKKAQYDKMFPPLINNNSKVSGSKKCSETIAIEPEECTQLLDNLKEINKNVVTDMKKKMKLGKKDNQTQNQTGTEYNTRSKNKKQETPIISSRIKQKAGEEKRKTTMKRKAFGTLKMENIGVKKRKQNLNRRNMSIEEQKEYWREQKSSKREMKRQQNEGLYKTFIAAEKSVQREKKRNENEGEFKQTRAAEMSVQREKKRNENECQFKKTRAVEKSVQREKKKEENESEYKDKNRIEQQNTRMKRISTEENRRKVFKQAIKYGRIFECVSCQRLCFVNGVQAFTYEFESKLEQDLINKSIGKKENVNKTHDKFHICKTCRNHISKGKVPPMSNQNSLQLMDLWL